jgi:hypothetical protein
VVTIDGSRIGFVLYTFAEEACSILPDGGAAQWIVLY